MSDGLSHGGGALARGVDQELVVQHRTMRGPTLVMRAFTVTAHILNSSAAVHWITAFQP